MPEVEWSYFDGAIEQAATPQLALQLAIIDASSAHAAITGSSCFEGTVVCWMGVDLHITSVGECLRFAI